jgi:hypothetical protein
MQICLPGREYANPPQVSATLVHRTGWMASGVLRVGETTVHQPVFRKDIQIRDTRAAIIEVADPGERPRYYVVTLPLTLTVNGDSWSDWQAPTFRTQDDPSFNLLHDRKVVYGLTLSKLPLDDSSPRVRFKLDGDSAPGWIVERRLDGEKHDLAPCS